MGKVPIWTSTKNSVDRDSEDGYIATFSNDLIRIESDRLAALNPESMDLRKSFDVKALVRMPTSWIEKTVPKILDVADSGLDLSMKHIRIEVRDNVLHMYAMTSDRAIVLKTDIEMNQDPEGVQDFGIIVSAEQLRAVYGFISKTFGYGACELGVKTPASNCESLLLVCYSKISDNDVEANSPKEIQEAQKIKAAMFKLERSAGELPMDIFSPPEFLAKFSASVVPTLRWVFGQKSKYVELRSNAGILEAQYELDNRAVRTSLGAKIVTSENLADLDGVTLASVDGTYMLDIFNYVKTAPIQLTFGTIFRQGKELPSFLYANAPEMSAIFAQSYRQDLPEGVTYITRKKGKLEVTTEQEATTRAMKQNKKGNEALIEVDAAYSDCPTPTEAAEALNEVVVPQPMLDELKDCEDLAKLSVSTSERHLKGWEECVFDIAMSLRKLVQLLEAYSEKSIIPAPVVASSSTVPATSTGENTGERVYDLDAIIAWLEQRIGEEFSTAVIRDTLNHIKDTTIGSAVNRLSRLGILIPVKRGVYRIPEDFKERLSRMARKGRRSPEASPA